MVLEVGVCAQNNSETILLAVVTLLMMFLIFIGISKRSAVIGIFGALGMLFLSLFIVGCIALYAYLLAGFALVSIIGFALMKP